jgi:hypothetical protein
MDEAFSPALLNIIRKYATNQNVNRWMVFARDLQIFIHLDLLGLDEPLTVYMDTQMLFSRTKVTI